jgi:hypothetical protein
MPNPSPWRRERIPINSDKSVLEICIGHRSSRWQLHLSPSTDTRQLKLLNSGSLPSRHKPRIMSGMAEDEAFGDREGPGPLPGEGLLRSLGSVKLISADACLQRLGEGADHRYRTAHVIPPGALIGRGPHADVRIDRPEVSWEHYAIQPVGVDWTVVPLRSRMGVRIKREYGDSLLLPVGFPWFLVDGSSILVGETELVVEVNRPDSVGATTAAAARASEVLPQELFETALALTAPYRDSPPRHTFTPVRELLARLDGVTSAKGIYLRLERLEAWPGIKKELQQRRDSERTGLSSALPGSGSRYAELAAAIVSAYPGFARAKGGY